MAYAGMLFTMSPDPEEPFAPPGAMNDVITGTYLFGGILAALMRRARTGRGETVTGSLLQSALVDAGAPRRLGRQHRWRLGQLAARAPSRERPGQPVPAGVRQVDSRRPDQRPRVGMRS